VRRLRQFMGKATRNGKVPAWMAQLDIRSFFMSIDKDILFAMLERKLLRKSGPDDAQTCAMLYLPHRVAYHCCAHEYVFKGNPAIHAKVPPHKTLIQAGEGRGLPIGNLTSQFFANVYLNELDQFVKHVLGCRHYVRYVDDFILLSENPATLAQWVARIGEFLHQTLRLQLKEGWRIKRVTEGANFLGYIVRPGYLLVRNRVVNTLKAQLARIKEKMVQRLTSACGRPVDRFNLDQALTDAMMQTIASYLGHFKHADSYRLIQTLFAKNPWLLEYFSLKKGRLIQKHRSGGVFASFRAQVRFFKKGLKKTVLLFQVGSFYELCTADARDLGKTLGLRVETG